MNHRQLRVQWPKWQNYSLLPLLPPFLRVLSVGIGVTSSASVNNVPIMKGSIEWNETWLKKGIKTFRHQQISHTYTANLHARTGKSSERRLSTRTRSLSFVATSSTKLNVKGVDAKFLICCPGISLYRKQTNSFMACSVRIASLDGIS